MTEQIQNKTKELKNSRRNFRKFEKNFIDRVNHGGMRECGGQFSLYRVDPLLFGKDYKNQGMPFIFYMGDGNISVAGESSSKIDLTIFNEEYRGNKYLLLRLDGFQWNGASNSGCGMDRKKMTDGIYFFSSAKDDFGKDPYISLDMADESTWEFGPLRKAVSEICEVDIFGHRNPFFKGVYFSRQISSERDIQEVINARRIYDSVKSDAYEFLRPPVYDKKNLDAMKAQVKIKKERLEDRLKK